MEARRQVEDDHEENSYLNIGCRFCQSCGADVLSLTVDLGICIAEWFASDFSNHDKVNTLESCILESACIANRIDACRVLSIFQLAQGNNSS